MMVVGLAENSVGQLDELKAAKKADLTVRH